MKFSLHQETILRHPLERPVFILFAILNLAIMSGAVYLAVAGAPWLGSHPLIKKNIARMRTFAIIAVLSPPALVVFRHARYAYVRCNSIRLSTAQIPEIHAIHVRHCGRLGVDPVPELYFSDTVKYGPANAFTSWGLSYIVLGSDYLQPKLGDLTDVNAFHLGRQLGRLRLGHASWVHELLLSYVMRIPYVKNLLVHIRTFSEDRYGAYLAPEGLRGLTIVAAGRRMLSSVNTSEVLKQAQSYGGFWAFVSGLSKENPHVMRRISELLEAGLLVPDAEQEVAQPECGHQGPRA